MQRERLLNGELGFGGNAGYQTARVAIHEISRQLGTGTTETLLAKVSLTVLDPARAFVRLRLVRAD